MSLLLYDDVGTGTHLPADETQHSRDKDTDASDTTDNTQIDTDTDKSWLADTGPGNIYTNMVNNTNTNSQSKPVSSPLFRAS